jgi:Tol biopolymer transport system component
MTLLRRHVTGGGTLLVALMTIGGCTGSPGGTSPGSIATASGRASELPTPEANASSMPVAPALEGQIVFYDDASASTHPQIFIEHADGTDAHRLVVSNFNDQKPALSPDGRKVAFTRYVPDGTPQADGGVFVVNVDGTGLTQVDPNGEDVAWSPDGTQLAETRALFDATGNIDNVAIWVMRADGSGAHQVTLVGLHCPNACANGAQDNQANWSPNGTRLAFLRDTYTSPEQFAIFSVAVDGSDLQRVTPVGMNVGDPDWSPDGGLIAFQSPPEANQGGEQNIFTIHPEGSGLTQLTSHLSSSPDGKQGTNQASWSPDGTQIVFSHNPGLGGLADLFVMNLDGSGLHVIAATGLSENGPDWGSLPGG